MVGSFKRDHKTNFAVAQGRIFITDLSIIYFLESKKLSLLYAIIGLMGSDQCQLPDAVGYFLELRDPCIW